MSTTEWMLCVLALMGLFGLLAIPIGEHVLAIQSFHEKVLREEKLVDCSSLFDRSLSRALIHASGECSAFPYAVHGATISLNEYTGGGAHHYG